MSFKRRLFLFIVGVGIGSIFCVMLFGKERFSCSGYFPNERVLEELKTKTWKNEAIVNQKLATIGITEKNIKDSILSNAEIDFDKSKPRKKPCGEYYMKYPAQGSKYIFHVEKCKDTARIKKIDSII